MKVIYVDMDGVIANFHQGFIDMHGNAPNSEGESLQNISKNRQKEIRHEQWHNFIDRKGFEKLEWFPGGDKLVYYLNTINVQKCILSSSGGFDRNREVAAQKYKWLELKGILWPAVIVPGRKFKAGFANGMSFIIDDTPDVIKDFCANGGNGIMHKNVDDTIRVVGNWCDPKYTVSWT